MSLFTSSFCGAETRGFRTVVARRSKPESTTHDQWELAACMMHLPFSVIIRSARSDSLTSGELRMRINTLHVIPFTVPVDLPRSHKLTIWNIHFPGSLPLSALIRWIWSRAIPRPKPTFSHFCLAGKSALLTSPMSFPAVYYNNKHNISSGKDTNSRFCPSFAHCLSIYM